MAITSISGVAAAFAARSLASQVSAGKPLAEVLGTPTESKERLRLAAAWVLLGVARKWAHEGSAAFAAIEKLVAEVRIGYENEFVKGAKVTRMVAYVLGHRQDMRWVLPVSEPAEYRPPVVAAQVAPQAPARVWTKDDTIPAAPKVVEVDPEVARRAAREALKAACQAERQAVACAFTTCRECGRVVALSVGTDGMTVKTHRASGDGWDACPTSGQPVHGFDFGSQKPPACGFCEKASTTEVEGIRCCAKCAKQVVAPTCDHSDPEWIALPRERGEAPQYLSLCRCGHGVVVSSAGKEEVKPEAAIALVKETAPWAISKIA